MDSVFRNGGFRGVGRAYADPVTFAVSEETPNRIDPVGLNYTTYTANVDTFFSCDLIFPVTPTDGLIWESGGGVVGAWIGIRDSGSTLRLRGGDGSVAISASGVDVALAETTDFPKDGLVHNLAWDFQISTGRARIFIDGVLKAEGFATNGAFKSGISSGSGVATFLSGPASNYPVGESPNACNLTESGAGLRHFENQQIVVSPTSGTGMWSMLPKYEFDYPHADANTMRPANRVFAGLKNIIMPVEANLALQLDARDPNSYPGTGATWFDTSGNAANMTLTNGPVHSTDFVFDGTNKYGIVYPAAISASNDFTVEMMVKFNSFQSSRSWLAVMGGSGTTGQIHWIQSTSGSGQYGIWGGGQVGPQFVLNQWYHIVQRFYGTTMDLYLDGVLLGPVSATRNFADNSLRLGWRPINESYFNGSVSFVRVYSAKLTEAEVLQNYTSMLQRS